MSLPKFTGSDLNSTKEFTHPNLWQRDEYPSWSRITLGAKQGEIPLILELCRDLDGPFGILWVLLASRVGHEFCRVQINA